MIALAGVLVSVATSLFTSIRMVGTELQKLRTEIQQTYAGNLLEKRLDIYPGLYALLSDFIKQIQFDTVSRAALEKLRAQMEEWDSKHSIFFSGRTGVICYGFRLMLAQLLQETDEELQRKLVSDEFLRELRHRVQELELALKADLGIYVVEFSDPGKHFKSYQEVVEAIGKQPGQQAQEQ